ncbi:hypothetical protein DFQ28_005287 [Apophysomyces sp. BC1034]|nr:hypothetical protein DFQ30_004086 [Apophysomyces sp. BC1015]KAG0177928.1 hypothetical protein DFQ29_004165 [Apophysomyces sp. BC1021]KAG0188190.1 hypothetical protein DFQ28_005287 [Apophysomyces sp. BC1034]
MSELAMNEYIAWIKDNGGSFRKLDFKNDVSGIGSVYATETVNENESFATVPFRLAITETVARKTFPYLSDVSCRIVMSLFLVHEKLAGDGSFYAPYLNVLPEKIMTPFFYNEDDMRYLENTNLATATGERKKAVFEAFQQVLGRLSNDIKREQITWDNFLWAYTVLTSRAFPYTLIDPTHKEPSEVLFPLVDSLNHKPNTKITWMRSGDDETGSLSFVSGQTFHAGEQMYNNYGPKSNEELLLGYGFCFESNEHDHVALKPNFSRDHYHNEKLSILQQCGVESGNHDPLIHYVHRGHIPEAFLKLMRVLVMNDNETLNYTKCTDGSLLDFVGYRNELAMLIMTNTLLGSRLHAIERVALDRHQATWWQHYALMYRDGQIDVLRSALKIIETMKQTTLKKMAYDLNHASSSAVPFLSIQNPKRTQVYESLESDPLVTLDNVVITTKKLLRDRKFKSAVDQLFEDEDDDVMLMLALINERSKNNSLWRAFFERVEHNGTLQDEDSRQELQDLYDSLFPAFSEAFPDIFDQKIYSFEALVWAESIIRNHTIDNPLAIVPL